jgi:hypothetical protein
MKKINTHSSIKNIQGFILPFTMLISAIVLFIVAGSMALLSKQLYFSKIYKQSQTAYYAADDAIACAVAIDDTYLGADGLGIFPSIESGAQQYVNDTLTYINERRDSLGFPTIDSVNDIACAQSKIFDPIAANFAIVGPYTYISPNGPEIGVTSSYDMRMDLGDGTFRCSKVTVNKTATFRQVIAQGYAQCDNPNGAVERAVVNTTLVE